MKVRRPRVTGLPCASRGLCAATAKVRAVGRSTVRAVSSSVMVSLAPFHYVSGVIGNKRSSVDFLELSFLEKELKDGNDYHPCVVVPSEAGGTGQTQPT